MTLITELAWDALRAANDPPRLFLLGDAPVRVKVFGGDAAVEPLTADRMKYEVTRAAIWYSVNVKGKRRPASPRMEIIRDMLASPAPDLPRLERIVRAPVFAPDGSLVSVPGYHDRARVYLAPTSGLVIKSVSPKPSRNELEKALAILDELVLDFPFASESDKAHAFALLLLPFARGLIDGPTPLHMFEKPTPGTGATLLARAIGYISSGREPEMLTEGEDDAEWRKKITATLLESPPILVFDNLHSKLNSSALAALLTAWPYWSDRLLGASQKVRVPNTTVFVATANNPTYGSDMLRRVVRSRLDSGKTRPEDRTGFKHPDLMVWVKENRAELVWACLTMIQAWIARGRRRWDRIPIGSFEAWRDVIGGILDGARIGGFLTNFAESRAQGGVDESAWWNFCDCWWETFGKKKVRASDLLDLARGAGIAVEWAEVGTAGIGRSDEIRLGMELHRHLDRRFGMVIVRKATRRALDRRDWYLEKVKPSDTPDTPDIRRRPSTSKTQVEDTRGTTGRTAVRLVRGVIDRPDQRLLTARRSASSYSRPTATRRRRA